MKNPLVSVIIPTYNYARFICEAIDSVFNSDFPQNEIEIIVIDDGSTDDTYEKVMIYGERVKYIVQENSGKAWATQVGINYARGKYLFNLDADDFFFPNKIQEVVRVFETDPSIVHVAHPAVYWYVNEDKKIQEAIPPNLVENKMIGDDLLLYFYERRILFGGGSTFAGRTDTIRKFLIPKEVDMYIDEYLVLFTLNQGYSFFIEKPLSIWRIHGKNFSQNSFDESIFRSQAERSLKSMEAILEELNKNIFLNYLKEVYLLKLQIERISIKEHFHQKYLVDIIYLWIYFFQMSIPKKYNKFNLIKSYTLLNRSIPTTIFRFLKNLKQ